MAREKGKNANYNFEVQKDPARRMGQGDYANLPPEPKMMAFSKKPDYRDGLINSFTCNVSETSDIYENEREP